MSEDSPAKKASSESQLHRSTREARKVGAAARDQAAKEELRGQLAFGIGLLGLLATVWWVTETADGDGSPYIWDAVGPTGTSGMELVALKIAAYLLSYAFIGGLAFTVLWNYSREKIALIPNFLFAAWCLATVLLFALPIIRSIQTFIKFLPSAWGGNPLVWIWIPTAYGVVRIVMDARTARKSQ